MINFKTVLTNETYNFFQEYMYLLLDFKKANTLLKTICGINSFFNSQDEASELLGSLKQENKVSIESERREYGDFQTNENLTSMILEHAYSKRTDIEFILEPTCGKGNFIIAALRQYQTLKKIIGVEIYKPYIFEAKINILTHFLLNKNSRKPEIDIIHGNAFEFSYENISISTKRFKTLVVGNPPWITNSELGSIESKNLPKKTNFKNHSGIDALTGKGNFDIGEYITILMLKCFHNHDGLFCFLIKNSIVKNIIQDQKQYKYRIGKSEMLKIDSKKEFNVSVKSSLFLSYFNLEPDLKCKEIDFYSKKIITTIGWHKDKFVYSVKNYDQTGFLDGRSKFIWRSGVKHDCSKVMELELTNGLFKNGFGNNVNLEENLIYGLLKSSDLKGGQIRNYRKSTIITQKRIGQETDYIKIEFPQTYQYLQSYRDFFMKRKSSIYKGKPDFSIFGIGDYSFAKYKVAISGLYKSTHFSLIKPHESKPIMLDDTCYFIGFNSLKMAQIAYYILNSKLVQDFLKSIIFTDAKRSINKDTLMRIDLFEAYTRTEFKEAKVYLPELSIINWEEFGELVKSNINESHDLV